MKKRTQFYTLTCPAYPSRFIGISGEDGFFTRLKTKYASPERKRWDN
ncbi:MAG: hypothetical protein JW837_19050 [Sedimentisphaerales bacterium]|nr:hypothetical protein [Sedimentisphaerales bacterium]